MELKNLGQINVGNILQYYPGADAGFQVRGGGGGGGGGGGALKKIAPSRGRRENCWGISCEKSDFSNFRGGGGREIFGVFHVKNHDFTPKKIIFLPILEGARAGCARPLNPPLLSALV